MRRFALSFIALVMLFSVAVQIDGELFGGAATDRLTDYVATILTRVMTLAGADVTQSGHTIFYHSATFAVLSDCTGIEVMGLFAAAVLAFPSRWRQRFTALGVGIPLLIGLNFIRMVSLIYFGARSPAVLHYGHLYVWPLILLTVALGMWLQWARSAAGDLHILA